MRQATQAQEITHHRQVRALSTCKTFHMYRRYGKPFVKNGLRYQTYRCNKCLFCYDEVVVRGH